MANIFKNQYTDLGTSNSDVVDAISSGTGIVLTLRCTNVDGSSAATVTVEVVDGSSGDAKIASTMTVPADSSIELAGTSKIVLEAGDKIDLTGGAASGDLEAFVSVLEIT